MLSIFLLVLFFVIWSCLSHNPQRPTQANPVDCAPCSQHRDYLGAYLYGLAWGFALLPLLN